MEQVFSYRIPVLHPLFVHFPIAVSACVLLVVGLWTLSDRRPMLVWAAWGQVLVFLATLAAWWTGDAMKEQSEGVRIVDELVGLHEQAAEWSLWVSGVLVLVLWSVWWWTRRDATRSGTTPVLRVLVALAVAGGFGLLAWVSHIGGVMVWGIPAS